MVCAHCGSESHNTGSSACEKYCTLCAQPGHRQKRGTCPYRECNTCGATGHSARECPSKTVSVRHSFTEEAQMQHDRPSDEVCERCREHGHIEAHCPKPRCKACGSSLQTIETLAASHALGTSVRNAKARWIQKGTIRIIAHKY